MKMTVEEILALDPTKINRPGHPPSEKLVDGVYNFLDKHSPFVVYTSPTTGKSFTLTDLTYLTCFGHQLLYSPWYDPEYKFSLEWLKTLPENSEDTENQDSLCWDTHFSDWAGTREDALELGAWYLEEIKTHSDLAEKVRQYDHMVRVYMNFMWEGYYDCCYCY